MNNTKFIHIDYRVGRSKEEKSVYALSHVDVNTAEVFINVHKNRNSQDLADTFFHEMAHVFFAFHGKDKQMTDTEEEELALQVGRICAGVLK